MLIFPRPSWRGSGWSCAVCWIGCRLSAGPVPWVCRILRIRTRATPGRVRARAPDLRGHWAHKELCGVGSALILRLRQNRPPTTARTVHNPPQDRTRSEVARDIGTVARQPGPVPGRYEAQGLWRRPCPGTRPDGKTAHHPPRRIAGHARTGSGPAARGRWIRSPWPCQHGCG